MEQFTDISTPLAWATSLDWRAAEALGLSESPSKSLDSGELLTEVGGYSTQAAYGVLVPWLKDCPLIKPPTSR